MGSMIWHSARAGIAFGILLGGAFLLSAPEIGQAQASSTARLPKNFIYFGLDRERIHEESFLRSKAVVGAQLKYTWRELEPERDIYELDAIIRDLEFLEGQDKRLFVHLQDVSFEEGIVNVPDYLREDPEFGGGVARQFSFEDEAETNLVAEGWVARRWDPAVRERLISLLEVMGEELDGRIAGLNLAETSIGFGDLEHRPNGFSCESYRDGVKALMSAGGEAFRESHLIQYANFMPGEWLPWNDQGFLRSVYEHAGKVGVGVGGPDLLPHRKGQQNHPYQFIRARAPGTVAGVAVQWGNLASRNPETGERVTVKELYEFARDELRLDYIFWGTQEPYYSREILPYLGTLALTDSR